jgi:hypothetical protein
MASCVAVDPVVVLRLTRPICRDLAVAYAAEAKVEPGERFGSLAALVDRLERGIRLM